MQCCVDDAGAGACNKWLKEVAGNQQHWDGEKDKTEMGKTLGSSL